MEDLLFNESLNEPIFSVLSKYTHTKGKFIAVYTNIVTKKIHHIVNNSIGSIEGEMRAYISEKERSRTFEVISLIKSILERNNIIWQTK